MGKIFYGTDSVKEVAMQKANSAAKNYKSGKCYTPSSRIANSCTFNESTNLWTCYSAAHHHWGSCGSKEITSPHHGGPNPTPPIVIPLPHPFPDDFIVDPDTKEKLDTSVEQYEDASEEDYLNS
ncbi:hypothetical protein FAZ19_16345 [Sphingobacterium alkalisoli]|uniref:Uncharacterized protein n=1 Tax=Sphingobacterium alkalisoli TaxID=1874115 RepID=A0A4U0GXR7_9SPHI|nr:hypothetical protein [Sphingobacterium alkalisoli]TJY63836.1 hypothetical protein FAZ19_16345 [Sphingobacterium alkalisoli]GGH24550.1 hypothetical protein GCM10011418_32560 [Sphingobacterium alkalisoli]